MQMVELARITFDMWLFDHEPFFRPLEFSSSGLIVDWDNEMRTWSCGKISHPHGINLYVEDRRNNFSLKHLAHWTIVCAEFENTPDCPELTAKLYELREALEKDSRAKNVKCIVWHEKLNKDKTQKA